jgi:hypothetical protein
MTPLVVWKDTNFLEHLAASVFYLLLLTSRFLIHMSKPGPPAAVTAIKGTLFSSFVRTGGSGIRPLGIVQTGSGSEDFKVAAPAAVGWLPTLRTFK